MVGLALNYLNVLIQYCWNVFWNRAQQSSSPTFELCSKSFLDLLHTHAPILNYDYPNVKIALQVFFNYYNNPSYPVWTPYFSEPKIINDYFRSNISRWRMSRTSSEYASANTLGHNDIVKKFASLNVRTVKIHKM